jgi:adenylate kinase family enzyme
MGVKNYLIDGVSCAGKTTICDELQRRSYHTIHGDEELAYWGNRSTGEPVDGSADEQHTWMWDTTNVHLHCTKQRRAQIDQTCQYLCRNSCRHERLPTLSLYPESLITRNTCVQE